MLIDNNHTNPFSYGQSTHDYTAAQMMAECFLSAVDQYDPSCPILFVLAIAKAQMADSRKNISISSKHSTDVLINSAVNLWKPDAEEIQRNLVCVDIRKRQKILLEFASMIASSIEAICIMISQQDTKACIRQLSPAAEVEG